MILQLTTEKYLDVIQFSFSPVQLIEQLPSLGKYIPKKNIRSYRASLLCVNIMSHARE